MRIIRNILQTILLAILLALCAALLYVLVIMGDGPKTDIVLEATPAPALASMPQDSLRFAASDLYQAEYYFSEPFAHLPENAGWQLDGVVVTDYVPQGQQMPVRELCLRYIDEQTGAAISVSTITPGHGLRALPGSGFVAATNQDWTICGLRAVLMRKDMTLHLHAQRGEVVYQIEGDIDADTLQRVAPLVEL